CGIRKKFKKDEYNEFYKKTFNEFLEPLAYTHFTTETACKNSPDSDDAKRAVDLKWIH
ncbi:hypothetical protein PIB30_040024, partial [Stylosanthes scabra]|nr:hypothetical protein [Stylosanthes scabra]